MNVYETPCFFKMNTAHQNVLRTLITMYSQELDDGPLLPELAYTYHDFTHHCQSIYRCISKILITSDGYERLSSDDLFKLNTAVLLHDLSMTKSNCVRERHGQQSAELLLDRKGKYYQHLQTFISDEDLEEICIIIRAHTDDKSVNPPRKTLKEVCENPNIDAKVKVLTGILRLADELDTASFRVNSSKYDELKALAQADASCRDSLRHWERCMCMRSVRLRAGYTNCIHIQTNDPFLKECPHWLELLRECKRKLMKEFKQFNECIYNRLPLASSVTANWNQVYFTSETIPDLDRRVSSEPEPEAEPPPESPDPLTGMIALSYSEVERSGSNLNTADLLDRLSRFHYLALLGPSGAGKTISLYQLRQEATRRGGFEAVLTFELAQYISANGDQITRYAERELERRSLIGRNGRVLLLLDGLNEVPILYQPMCNQELDRLVDSGRYSILLTSRPYGTFPSCYACFRTYQVDPLDEPRILTIARTQLSAQFPSFEDGYRMLPPSIQAAMKTPLFLGMCITLFQETGRIPAKRSVIYHDYFDLLFRRDRGAASAAPAELKHLAAQKIAFRMQESALVMSCQEGLSILAKHQQECVSKGLYAAKDYPAASTLRDALLGSTVLVPVGTDTFRFYHESYQEYYAARELSELLAQNYEHYRFCLSNRRWEEIVKYLAGIFPDSSHIVDELITDDVQDNQLALALEIAYQEDFAPEIRDRIFRKIERYALSRDVEDQKTALDAMEFIQVRAGLSEREQSLLKQMRSRRAPANIRRRIGKLLDDNGKGE